MAGLKVAVSSDESTALGQLDSTSQGFLVPRMTTAQRDAISSPAEGLLIYNTDNDRLEEYNGTASAWQVAGGRTDVDITDVTNPPTDAELDSAFGTPAAVGSGFWSFLDDNDGDANLYLVMSNGTSWWYVALTKAV